MSEHQSLWQMGNVRTLVNLPHDLDGLVQDWTRLRKNLLRRVPAAFTRDEWAYVVTFLDPSQLWQSFERAFGVRASAVESPIHLLVRPREPIAVWLPNNVSLLGPLTLVLLSLTGARLRLKAGSRAEDLTTAFVEAVRGAAPGEVLTRYLDEAIQIERFERDDPRAREMAGEAQVRIVFGGDDAARAIGELPHPVGAVPIVFSDRRSEAWVEPEAVSPELVDTLLRVFAIYGQAGCTSPARVVLLGAEHAGAVDLRDRLLERWSEIMTDPPAMHHASANVMARQWAAAEGWNARLAPGHGAVLAAGMPDLAPVSGPMLLPIVAATVEEAVATLPPNIQTVGHGVLHGDDPRWLRVIASTPIKRFVPLARMHHFGPTWDGYAFWRQLFEEVEVIQ